MLEMEEIGESGGLVSSGRLFVTALNALTRGKAGLRSTTGTGDGLEKFVDGKNGRLLLFGITSANSPVGNLDGIN